MKHVGIGARWSGIRALALPLHAMSVSPAALAAHTSAEGTSQSALADHQATRRLKPGLKGRWF